MLNWLDNYEDAIQQATAARLPILLQFYKTNCSGCQKMDHEVFSDETLVSEIRRKFVPPRQDILAKTRMRSQYSAIWTPSFYFLNSRGAPFWFFEGALNTEDFLFILAIGEVHILLPKGRYSEAPDILESLIQKYPTNPRTAQLIMLNGMAYYLKYSDKDAFHAAMSQIVEEHPQSAEAGM